MSLHLARASALLGFAACSAGNAFAQRLAVEVRDATSRTGLAGAVVTAVERSTGTKAFGLTNDAGRVSVKLPMTGSWAVSVRRIGVIPSSVAAVRVDSAQTVSVSIVVSTAQFQLPAVRVTAIGGDCGSAPNGDDRVSALWGQVTLALRAATLTPEGSDAAPALRVEMFERVLKRSKQRVTETSLRSGTGTDRPFFAASPDSLSRLGYVRRGHDGTLHFFAPDERVLLSESFVQTHCFDAPPSDVDPRLAELHFRPAPGRTLPDVAGIAYVDVSTGELRRIEFHFVNVDQLFVNRSADAGGSVALRRLANGQWLVSEWSIRMPTFLRVSWRAESALSGYREVGGRIVLVDSAPSPTRVSEAVDTVRQSQMSPSTEPSGSVRPDGITARMVERRSGFEMRRRFGGGEFLDSVALARPGLTTAAQLLLLLPELRLLQVPDGTPLPPVDDDVDLAREWRTGADLPMMRLTTDSVTTWTCLVKLFLDGKRASVTQLAALPSREVAALEFYRAPPQVPPDFRRSGNRCGTAVLWSYSGDERGDR